VPHRVKPSFVIFDSRAERQSARMSKITNDGFPGLAQDSCTHMATVGVKGLSTKLFQETDQRSLPSCSLTSL